MYLVKLILSSSQIVESSRYIDEQKNMGVSYYESPVFAVAKFLRERGYEIADCIGMRTYTPNRAGIGILKPKPPVERRFLFFRLKVEQRALFIGVLWFDNKPRGAKLDKTWILEVNGREYVQELIELAKELAKIHSKDIRVVLKQENSKLETYLRDFDD